MKVSYLNRIKYLISEMMNEEYDEHAKLLIDVKKRTPNLNLLNTLTLVHDTKIQLLEEIFKKLKEIK